MGNEVLNRRQDSGIVMPAPYADDNNTNADVQMRVPNHGIDPTVTKA